MTPTVSSAADVLMRDYMALKPGETVLITADTDSDEEVWQAVLRASLLAGANASVHLIPPLPYQGRLADPYVTPALGAAALAADVWIDFTFPYLAGSELHDHAMETEPHPLPAGCRPQRRGPLETVRAGRSRPLLRGAPWV